MPPLPPCADEAPDSLYLLDALLGKSNAGRDELIVEGVQGKIVLRRFDWVYIPPYDGPAVDERTKMELGNAPVPQLYNLALDVGQIINVAAEQPIKTQEMSNRLEQLLDSARTRPGAE